MRRSKFEQMIEVLDVAVKPITKTNVMFKARVTWIYLKKIFEFLEQRGFLERVEPPRVNICENSKYDKRVEFRYRTTQKGLDALNIYSTWPLSELREYYDWLE